MNKRQKLVQQRFLNNEKEVIDELKKTYTTALDGINENIKNLNLEIDSIQGAIDVWEDFGGDEEKEILQSQLRSKIYQKQYQEALQGQIDDVLDKMNTEQFNTVTGYLKTCYDDGYIGTFYDLQGQGVPLIMPIDQESVVRAVQTDSKISQGLYTRMGEDVTGLKKVIASEVSRGILTGMTYEQVAKQITYKMVGTGYKEGGAMSKAMRIARTEGHRIQCQAGMDACYKAKDMGADVVKQWDSTLDGLTRSSHRQVDGEVKELDEKFSNGLMFPGDPSGKAAEVVNCRCSLLQRHRWAVGGSFTKMNNFTKEIETFNSPEEYDEFKKAFWSKENRDFMNYHTKLEEKYETRKFEKLLCSMDDKEYKKYKELMNNSPMYNKKPNIMGLNETVKITKKKGETNPSSVNRKLVNSKEYHDKFENITEYKAVNESIYQESMRMLEHRDGTPFEDMVLLDAKTGKFITGNMSSEVVGKTGLTESQFSKVAAHKGDIIIVHNHPNSSRISAKDIITAHKQDNVSSVVAVGHDGTVHVVSNINRNTDIDKLWNEVYNAYVYEYKDKDLAKVKATTQLYEMNLFKYESR